MDLNESTYSNFMMIISPPAEVVEMIRKYKLSSARVIGAFTGMQSIAHISVTNQQRQMSRLMEQKLEYYQRKVVLLKAPDLKINGFGAFKHGSTSATIYAKIELNEPVMAWFMRLRAIFGDKQGFVPHITIVKDIPMDKFSLLWPHFEGRPYHHYFNADRLTVLLRPMINTGQQTWKPFKELYFGKV